MATIDQSGTALIPNATPASTVIPPVTPPVTPPTPVVTPPTATTTPVVTSPATNAVYDASTGFLTPYGVSIGAKVAQPNDPNAPKPTAQTPNQIAQNNQNNSPTPTSTTTPTLPTDSVFTTAMQNNGQSANVKSVTNNLDGSRTVTFNDGSTQSIGGDPNDPNQALAMSVTAANTAATNFSNTITGIQNGTIPLSAGDQAQIAGLQSQFNALIATQQNTNANATGTATEAAFRGGAGVGSDVLNNITAITSAGAQKVANLQAQEASSVASLTQSLKDGDVANIKEAYDAVQTANTNTQNALQKTIDEATAAINKAQTEKDAVTASINTIAEDAAKNDPTISPATVKAITSAPDVASAIIAAGSSLQTSSDPTIAAYLQYKKDTEAAGLTPQDYTTYTNQQAAIKSSLATKQAVATAAGSEAAKLQVDATANGVTPKQQTAITGIINKMATNKQITDFENVQNQGQIVASLPDSGLTQIQANELLAAATQVLVPGTNSLRGSASVITGQLGSKLGNLLISAQKTVDNTGNLSNTTVKQIKDAINSVYQTQENSYNQEVNNYVTQASNLTGLPASTVKGLLFNADTSTTDPKTEVNNYVTANPTTASQISALYKVPGATDAQVWAYIQQLPGYKSQ